MMRKDTQRVSQNHRVSQTGAADAWCFFQIRASTWKNVGKRKATVGQIWGSGFLRLGLCLLGKIKYLRKVFSYVLQLV